MRDVLPDEPQGKTLRVGINAQLLSQPGTYRSAGIHHYIEQLLRTLPQADPTIAYTAFIPPIPAEFGGIHLRRSKLPTQRPPVRIAWEQTVQPLVCALDGYDVFHGCANVMPWAAPCPAIITVHDLTFLRFPQALRPLNRWYLTWGTRLSLRRATRVIANSHSTATDIQRWMQIPPEKIRVIYMGGGGDGRFTPLPPQQVEQFRASRGLPERFVLYLGTLEPRKNLVHLIEAFARWRGTDTAVKLVLAGGQGWYYRRIFARVQELGLSSDVIFPGFVPDAEKALWYNAAQLFVYPSVYEGFGIPVVEAMACGTPTITSNISSLPEVAGDAALTVDVTDIGALTHAIAEVMGNHAKRSDLHTRGPGQAARFRWETTAAQTAALYRDVACTASRHA